VTMAQAGQEVVLIGCDLRRPRIQEFFGLPNDVGFTSVLVGDATLEDALISVPNVDRLTLLPSGPIPPNPSELLGSPRASQVFSMLGKEADLVIIDSPPVLPVTDAAVLAGKVDAVLLVVAAGGTTKREISRSIEALGRVDAAIVGMVLNKAAESDSYAYYRYGYGYGYGSRSKSDRATTNGARTGGQDFSVRPVSAPIRGASDSAIPSPGSNGNGNGADDPVRRSPASDN
jgi:succinoglycan biosynthesis transport protein ExoP